MTELEKAAKDLLNLDDFCSLAAHEIGAEYKELTILNYKEISKKEYDINMKGDKE